MGRGQRAEDLRPQAGTPAPGFRQGDPPPTLPVAPPARTRGPYPGPGAWDCPESGLLERRSGREARAPFRGSGGRGEKCERNGFITRSLLPRLVSIPACHLPLPLMGHEESPPTPQPWAPQHVASPPPATPTCFRRRHSRAALAMAAHPPHPPLREASSTPSPCSLSRVRFPLPPHVCLAPPFCFPSLAT